MAGSGESGRRGNCCHKFQPDWFFREATPKTGPYSNVHTYVPSITVSPENMLHIMVQFNGVVEEQRLQEVQLWGLLVRTMDRHTVDWVGSGYLVGYKGFTGSYKRVQLKARLHNNRPESLYIFWSGYLLNFTHNPGWYTSNKIIQPL